MTDTRSDGRPPWPVWIATCGPVGYFPFAPGTLGSALGVMLVAAIGRSSATAPRLSPYLILASAVTFMLGVWSAGEAEKFFDRMDPGQVVIDEVCGQIITFWARPNASRLLLLAGFVIFRVLDVIKPSPARRFERLPGGWGMVLDDVVAGAYSLVAVYLLGFRLR